MALSAPVKALALVVFLAAIAAATYGVSTVTGDTVGSQLVSVSAARAHANATPGNEVSYLLSISNRGAASRDVSVEIAGLAEGQSSAVTVRANATRGVFVTVDVPEGAPVGQHALDVRILSDGVLLRERVGALQLTVLQPAPGLAPGDSAEVIYAGRLTATGNVFNTNDPALAEAPFAKTDSYRFSQGLLPLETSPRPNIVAGLYEGMLGMQAGEHRTITFGPEKGYGPKMEEQVEPRDEVIARDLTLLNDPQRVARSTFDSYIQESGQGRPDQFKVGDGFTLDQNGNDWPYVVVNMTPQVVEYKLAAKPGEAYTVYPFWPNGSVVSAINETHVTFRTTPTTTIGQAFTMKAVWPQMSALHELDETRAVVRHSPPVGFGYTTVTAMGQPREATIVAVEDSRIVVGMPSSNPLAGNDLTFDVIVVSLTKGS